MTIEARLEQARRNLLELSTRNRLISMPVRRRRAKIIEIADERSDSVFRILVSEGREMSFLPIREELAETADINGLFAQPTSDDADRHSDKYLQTMMDSKALQKRLLTIYYDARTSLEETGINILYLALGTLKWFEADNAAEERYAPLLLIPVELSRESAEERFKVKWSSEDITSNLSLLEKMRLEFGLDLPAVPDSEDLVPSSYFRETRDRCAGMPRWEVLPDDMRIGFFSFAKLLMYHDLDPKSWPTEESLKEQALVSSLLMGGFSSEESSVCGEDKIDECVPVETAIHVVDADSSQTVAIEEVKAGRNLVIQGPPGTGKSQTIANLIAAAVVQGKKVLFVAEKLAALEVVKRRLDAIDLGSLCLELHSRKANKKAILEELRRTLQLAAPRVKSDDSLFEKLKNVRGSLNEFCATMHKVQQPSGMTAYRVLGELVHAYGTDPTVPDFELPEASRWSLKDHRENCAIVEELAARAAPIYPPNQHSWRGVQIDVLMPADKQRLLQLIEETVKSADALLRTAAPLSAGLGQPIYNTSREVEVLIQLGEHFVFMPTVDRDAMSRAVWSEDFTSIENTVSVGERYAAIVGQLQGKLTDSAWLENVRPLRDALTRYGDSFKRFFSKEYRQSLKQLRSLLRVPLPKNRKERLRIVETLIEFQEQWHVIASLTEVGQTAFGSLWRAHESDWSSLRAILAWVSRCGTFTSSDKFFASLPAKTENSEIKFLVGEARNALDTYQSALHRLISTVKLDTAVAFECVNIQDVPISIAAKRFASWKSEFETLPSWIAFRHQSKRANEAGLIEICLRLFNGQINPQSAAVVIDKVRLEAVLSSIIASHSILQTFSGDAHERQIAEFRKLDLARIDFARYEVAAAHYRDIPHISTTAGGLGTVQHEMQKKRRHLPIRKLIEKAGAAVQSIKPVFMMSPLSVAQFLAPGSVQFDLVLIDEASQVEPVDALGAIARASQVVVVGDDRQLPPSRFFMRVHDDEAEDEEDEENFQASDVESILGLCLAQGMRQTMLRWHYRSRHHSLIKVSNEHFYDNKLLVIPSAFAETPSAGVKFRFIRDGIFDRGASRTNIVEARSVASAVIEHARKFPNLTLGVGAFSLSQKDAILGELELLRRSEGSDAEGFFNAHPHEPFFVKNLENVQGDERDVIFISVGFGKDESGYLAMTFGPLSTDGGERRLNVLITRARIRCEVFSSITADDIDLERGRSKGVAAFKSYLHFAQTGKVPLGTSNMKELDSPFEEEVYRALTQLGYDVVGQVGIAGFFVDLAIRDPHKPGRFIVGIECDGVAYHSCRSARDRDRLRQQVLEDQGWFIHRIWSTDWLRSPEESLRRTIAAIEQARGRWSERDQDLFEPAQPDRTASGTITRVEQPLQSGSVADSLAMPYREARLTVETYIEPHRVAPQRMSGIIEQIVAQEGPVHRDEICRRITTLWGLQRTGNRITAAVKAALNWSLRKGKLESSGDFIDIALRPVRTVRSRADASLSLRRPEMLPPSEIRYALTRVVEVHFGITEEEAILQVARAFGFSSTSGQLRELIAEQVRQMVRSGELRLDNETLLPRSS
jgi:very-short-patch-repair endonuclease/energy-coupling factor transporter ATP-binding protein EcfA2